MGAVAVPPGAARRAGRVEELARRRTRIPRGPRCDGVLVLVLGHRLAGHSTVVGAAVARSEPTHLGYGATRTLGSKTGLHAVTGESTRSTLDIQQAFIEELVHLVADERAPATGPTFSEWPSQHQLVLLHRGRG